MCTSRRPDYKNHFDANAKVSELDCRKKCVFDDECKYFQYSPADGQCVLVGKCNAVAPTGVVWHIYKKLEKQTYTKRGNGKCPSNDHVGETSSMGINECRDRCEAFTEMNFIIWEEGGAQQCGCYRDCDSLEEDSASEAY